MKFPSTLALGVLAVPAAWAELSERDLATIQGVINSIGNDLQSVDTAVQAFNGDATDVTTASSTLLSDLKGGTTTISNTDAITLEDAIQLQQSATSLQTTGQSLVTNLENKKTAFEAANLCDVVREQVTQISTESQNLIDAIVSKVPQEAQQVASQLVSEFTTTLQQSEATYSTGNCTNADGTTSGGSNSTTTTGLPASTTTAVVDAGAAVGVSVGAVFAALFAFAM